MAKARPKFKQKKEKPEFDQIIVDLARVTRVTKGGKQLSFRACLIIGDRNGRVGFGVEKGKDVQIAVQKAFNQAKKNVILVPIVHHTIPHSVEAKFKAGKVMLKPAPQGSGIIAGSVIRTVLEMAGVPNVSAKMLSKTNNKITNVKATFKALENFKIKARVKKAVMPEGEKKAEVEKKKPAVKKTSAPKKQKGEK
ncbi:MAG: 30S ribosomal protein S5 [Candidatus Magasanikbacteria bacterium CG11_big_fil_rev_8_21_14_0_20_39_34]|uniref:Small ribosomal subunit protein uS5 n=1 Tax=Candidatus Magasanikbacteria bacterium CG11_big_fil_rev_8_21_14_0_20_39_34 TaxID=1974653 RepID=A0A2H0N3T9_9BACT|nr:MAG: 30S ribosomal protein S5 [Candidatus Magasanikbacteria bacterium CG11_big_fil_rev_8_21_14_0_20_39_34]